MDAVENCLKAIKNYDIKTATRTGTPNRLDTLLKYHGTNS